jgi:hypothetical protein
MLRMLLKLEPLCTLTLRNEWQDEHFTIAQNLQRNVQRAFLNERPPQLFPQSCRYPYTPLFDRHLTTCIITLYVLTNNHG